MENTSNISDSDRARITAIIDYWYPWPEFDRHTSNPEGGNKLWFGGDKETDEKLTLLFKEDLEATKRGENEHWRNDKEGRLAYIILLD